MIVASMKMAATPIAMMRAKQPPPNIARCSSSIPYMLTLQVLVFVLRIKARTRFVSVLTMPMNRGLWIQSL